MPAPTSQPPLTLLTLPPEIRNQVYAYVFVLNEEEPISELAVTTSPLAKALQLDWPPCNSTLNPNNERPPPPLKILLTCRQIHHEANLIGLSTTTFHLQSTAAQPEVFTHLTRSLSLAQLSALKHLTLTARISQLRALNETWDGRPFAHPSLRLDTLTLVPQRPDAGHTAWAEVAELDQCHTLAHVLAETLKRLKGVRQIRVVNCGCFGNEVWRLVYRHLVLKVWRWGGMNCGVAFENGEGEGENAPAWFKAFLGSGECRGSDAGVEAYRLLSAEGTSPGAVAMLPLP